MEVEAEVEVVVVEEEEEGEGGTGGGNDSRMTVTQMFSLFNSNRRRDATTTNNNNTNTNTQDNHDMIVAQHEDGHEMIEVDQTNKRQRLETNAPMDLPTMNPKNKKHKTTIDGKKIKNIKPPSMVPLVPLIPLVPSSSKLQVLPEKRTCYSCKAGHDGEVKFKKLRPTQEFWRRRMKNQPQEQLFTLCCCCNRCTTCQKKFTKTRKIAHAKDFALECLLCWELGGRKPEPRWSSTSSS